MWRAPPRTRSHFTEFKIRWWGRVCESRKNNLPLRTPPLPLPLWRLGQTPKWRLINVTRWSWTLRLFFCIVFWRFHRPRPTAGPRPARDLVNRPPNMPRCRAQVETAIVHRPIAAAYRDTTSHNVWLCLLYRKMSMPVWCVRVVTHTTFERRAPQRSSGARAICGRSEPGRKDRRVASPLAPEHRLAGAHSSRLWHPRRI